MYYIGMVCQNCSQEKTEAEMQTTRGRNGKVYLRKVCKRCVNKQICDRIRTKRRIVGTREWYRKRYDKLSVQARSRGRSFEITFEQAIELYSRDVCYFCEQVAEVRSIDRLDNSRDYVDGNCVMACLKCNKLKGQIENRDKSRMMKILEKL